MSPTPNIMMRAMSWLLAMLVLAAGCGSDTAAPDADAALCTPPTGNTAPTYTQLFTRYFAPGTPGHCAKDGCHNGPNFNIWMCGLSKDACYAGMASRDADLINTSNPKASRIANMANSPLSWINPNGPMPNDAVGPFPEGRDAIIAWVAACALNN